MRTVRVQGGLGNQLFCLAFARSVALLTGAPVALDVSSYDSDAHGRSFDLMDLAETLGPFPIIRRPWLGSRPRRLLGRWIRTRAFVAERETPKSILGLKALAHHDAYYDGYWQNENFVLDLEGCVGALRREIARRSSPRPALSTVIHYRTYKEERRRAARGAPGQDFFRQALDRIAAAGHKGDVFLVSDDPDLALSRLGEIAGRVEPIHGGGPWNDLAVLVAAENLILTNSSFSWWAGVSSDAARIFYPANQGFAHYPWPARRFIEI